MKTKITLSLLTLFIAVFCYNYNSVIANSSGSPGGRSSSAGDMSSSCGQGGCHGGGHTTQAGIITTDIPAAGYTPGTVYRINVAGTSGTGTKFGFELAAENASNATAGTLVGASTGTREQIRSNGHATHTSTGNSGVAGNFGWQLDWTAPSAGTGSVTFSTAVLAANGNGTNSGDNTIIFNTTVTENSPTLSVSELTESNTNLYPNPVVDYLSINSQVLTTNTISVMNLEGKVVIEATLFPVDRIDLSSLDKGIYLITVKNENSQITKKIMKL